METDLGPNPVDEGDVRRGEWVSAASYWQPPLFTVTAWLEHAPFAYWLMDAIRPGTVVELGTHYGYSYFVFCEAVLRLGLDARTYALDSWEGDDHAGFYGEEVYEFVSTTNEASYADFSKLIRGTFDDSLALVEDGSVDLLHIDGRHGYEDVAHDFNAWLPKLSARGVVLFHDVAERQDGFGVWKLWEELRGQHPAFAFDHAHGLGVLGVGREQPPALIGFFGAAKTEGDKIKRCYEGLGETLAFRAQLEAMPDEIRRLRAQVDALELERVAAQAAVLELQTEMARRSASMEARVRAMEASTSWRLTAPVRALGALWRQ